MEQFKQFSIEKQAAINSLDLPLYFQTSVIT